MDAQTVATVGRGGGREKRGRGGWEKGKGEVENCNKIHGGEK